MQRLNPKASFASFVHFVRLVLFLCCTTALVFVGSCTCGSSEGYGGETTFEGRPALLRGCVLDPQSALLDFRALAGDSFDGHRLPSTFEPLLSRLLGIPEDQLRDVADWSQPGRFALFEPPGGEPLTEGLAVHLRRPTGAAVVRPTAERLVETAGGALHLAAEGDDLWAANSAWALEAARAEGSFPTCDTEGGEITLELAPELLGSRPVERWIARQSAWLESSARQGTARYGRSELGDPEVAARAIGRWAETSRAGIEGEAPLRLRVDISAQSLELRVDGVGEVAARGDGGADSGDEARSRLSLIAPDAYFAIATRGTSAERAEWAQSAVDVVARVAADRMADEERERLGAAATALARQLDGELLLALRPALEPGPMVLLAAAECERPNEVIDAILELAGQTSSGHLRRSLEHLGAPLSVSERAEEGGRGSVALELDSEEAERAASENDEPARRSRLRQLLGSEPRLAWQVEEGLLLVALGQRPESELARMAEAAAGPSASSILAQPTLASVVDGDGAEDLVCFLWAPSLIGLLTQGGPGAGGLAPGGLAFSSRSGAEGEPWRGRLALDEEQLRSLLRWATGERAR